MHPPSYANILRIMGEEDFESVIRLAGSEERRRSSETSQPNWRHTLRGHSPAAPFTCNMSSFANISKIRPKQIVGDNTNVVESGVYPFVFPSGIARGQGNSFQALDIKPLLHSSLSKSVSSLNFLPLSPRLSPSTIQLSNPLETFIPLPLGSS